MNRKAQIEIQFNWIFVFIVGAIILGFFIFIVKSQLKASDDEMAVNSIKKLQSVIASSERASDTFKTIIIPRSNIQFNCEPGQDTPAFTNFEIEKPRVVQDTEFNILFAPHKISGNQLYTWTLDWKVPYRIGYFLMISNRKHKYVVVNNTKPGLARTLFKLLPNNLTKEIWHDPIDIKNHNYKSTRFIFFADPNVDNYVLDTSFKDQEVSAINIQSSSLDGLGEIEFFKLDGQKFKRDTALPFLEFPSIAGAIFSADADVYKCNMQKALERLKVMNQIVLRRLNNISYVLDEQVKPNTHFCSDTYYYTSIISTNEINKNIKFAKDNLTVINNHATLMKLDNDFITKGENCAFIY